MARESNKAGKSESLTIRLDPKTRFVLEYISRLKGQTITTVVERALYAAASNETVYVGSGPPLSWDAFWDPSEGIRALNIAECEPFFPTYEEQVKLKFCKEHWPFFYSDIKSYQVHRVFIDILWPDIDKYIEIHELRKYGGDYFAAGRAMQEKLRAAKIQAPSWPVSRSELNKKADPIKKNEDDDDEIPF